MRNRKVRDLAQSEEDSREATSKSSDGGNTSTSASSCPFGLSGQSLGAVSKSSGLQVINKEGDEEDQQRQHQHQRQKLQLQQYQHQQQEEEKDQQDQKDQKDQQDQVRAQLISMHRAIGGADAPREEEEATPATTTATTTTTTNTNRCAKCNKKLGLTGGFPCRCGGVYCAVHRYSDRHECNFDYRQLGASEIRRDNPLIVPDKLKKL